MSTRRRTIGILAVASMLALGGCTGGAKKPEPLVSASVDTPTTASPTTTRIPSVPSVAKPERPADMDRTDEVGAGAAAKYFLELYPYMMKTGDFSEWDALSWDNCQYCAESRALAVKFRDDDFVLMDGQVSAQIVTVHSLDLNFDAYPVDLITHQLPGSILDSSALRVGSVDEATISTRVDVKLDDSRWKMIAVANVGAKS